MADLKKNAFNICLGVIWLAVVIGAVLLAITRYEQYGLGSIIVVAMAVIMLVMFVTTVFQGKKPKPAGKRPARRDDSGRWLTSLLIAAALAALIFHLVKIFPSSSLAAKLIMIFFILVFGRIFIDSLRPARKKKRKPRKKGDEGEDPGSGQ